jgi:hypothetical protein
MLLLPPPGHMHGINTASHKGEPDDLALAEQIAGGCYEMYRQSPSGAATVLLPGLWDSLESLQQSHWTGR